MQCSESSKIAASPRETMIEAIESAMATAYKREYGKRGQVVRAKLDMNTGTSPSSR
jgi:hypothetical protein